MSRFASEDAMAEFILAGGKNFQTALLAYKAFPRAAGKLISNLAKSIERNLADEVGWKITSNTLASAPHDKYSDIKWAPAEWAEFGWGICLSPQAADAREIIFGIFAPSAANQDPAYLRDPGKHRVMSEPDRTRVGRAIAPLLASVGDRERNSHWWASFTYLRTIRSWMEPATLMKVASANGIGDERDLVSGKPMDVYIADMFRAAKLTIADLPGLRDIRPLSG